MRIQLRRDRGIRSCRAKLTRERLESFKTELERSAVCAVRAPRRPASEESDSIYLDLGQKRRCQLELVPSAWIKKPATRSVQLAIDRMSSDDCEGSLNCFPPDVGTTKVCD